MMKHFFVPVFILFFPVSLFSQQAKHVVLITIDGMNPAFYKDPAWPAPALQELKSEGAYAEELQPVFPSVTYPNHTSMITGAAPARHGICTNTPFEPLGSTGKWNWEYQRIKVPTLFDALRRAGKTTAAVTWPVSVGAPVDYNIADIWSTDTKKQPNKSFISQNSTPAGLYEEVQREATGNIPDDEVNGETIRTDQNATRMAAYIIEKYKPAFIAVHFFITDAKQHSYGRNNNEVRKAVANADACIQQVLDALEKAHIKDSTTIIITGDHGFSDLHTVFRPNVLLAKQGLATGVDWKVRFHSASAAAFLYVQKPADKKYVDQVRQLLKEMPGREQRLFRIIEKEQLTQIGADPNAELAITATPGVAISGSDKGELVSGAKGGVHGYYPDFASIQTGMVAWGSGIQKGIVIPQMRMVDIAPLIAKLLGIAFDCPDGILIPGLLIDK